MPIKFVMYPESLARILKYAHKHGISLHTVAVDARGAKPVYYYKAGVGSFRLSSMERLPNLKVLQERFAVTKGGPGSGNFGHAGRPGEIGGSGAGSGGKAEDLSPRVAAFAAADNTYMANEQVIEETDAD